MSELQQQMAVARQFVSRWSPEHLDWTRDHYRIVAMAILYGEQNGLVAAAAIAEETFIRLSHEVAPPKVAS